MLSRILQRRPLRFPTRSARLANLSMPAASAALSVPTRGARLASRRWLRHPPGPRVDAQRSQPWDGTRIVRFSKEDPIDRKRHWSKMSQQTRAAWIELGWNARNWDDGGSDPRLGGHVPWSEKYDWHELHATARAAAERLGYDERLWKLDDDDDGNKEWFIPAIFALLVVFYGIQALMTRAKWRRVGATREERGRLARKASVQGARDEAEKAAKKKAKEEKRRSVHKSNCRDASHDLHAIDATPGR